MALSRLDSRKRPSSEVYIELVEAAMGPREFTVKALNYLLKRTGVESVKILQEALRSNGAHATECIAVQCTAQGSETISVEVTLRTGSFSFIAFAPLFSRRTGDKIDFSIFFADRG